MIVPHSPSPPCSLLLASRLNGVFERALPERDFCVESWGVIKAQGHAKNNNNKEIRQK